MRSLGWQLIDWIETFLCEGPGASLGKPATVDDELAVFLVRAYELHAPGHAREGRRKIDRAAISRPKGRGKSVLAAKITCCEAIGPCRFSHWAEAGEVSDWGYRFEEGEPVGRPVTSVEILNMATEEGQADNTYGAVVEMLRHVARVHGDVYPGLDVGITRTFTADGGEITPVTAAAKSKDGGNTTFRVADETHLYDSTALHNLYDTVDRNLGKRGADEPWSLDTTTMFRPGDDSEAERFFDLWEDIQDGKLDGSRFLFDHRQIDPSVDWDDDAALLEGLDELYGPASTSRGGWIDPWRVLQEIRDPRKDPVEQKRYFGNLREVAEETWMPKDEWAACASPELVVADRDEITLGFDGSLNDDATALVGCHIRDGHLFVVDVWERPSGPRARDWEVPRGEVDAAVRRAFERWRVWRMYCDPFYWQSEVAGWQRTFNVKRERVVEWRTNRDQPMHAALQNLRTAVLTGQVTHDGDSRLADHMANARKHIKRTRDEDTSENRDLVLIRKERHKSPRKIDAAMAATLAWEARTDAIEAGRGRSARGGQVFL